MFFSSFPTCLSGYSLERCQFVDGEAEMKDSLFSNPTSIKPRFWFTNPEYSC